MTVILIRTVIFYIALTLIMRLMGKRQIGEIQLSEFVAAVMLSELAALPITDRDIPLFHGLVSLVALGSLEVITAFACRKLPRLRKTLFGEPIVLVAGGKIIDKGLDKARITLDEVLAVIRTEGYKSFDDVYYVILEQTGKISVLPKAASTPLTPKDSNITAEETGPDMTVMIEGVEIESFMERTGKTKADIAKILSENKLSKKDCMILAFDENGTVKLTKKETGK
ncbi:MAG: DUF421 domain-containing protein [Eubacteriales bacterium]|nr:DUF421 domain-containing protein [Eubacteriales bacterium]